MAIHLAVKCREEITQHSLLRIALDEMENPGLRSWAARGILDFGNAEIKAHLKPLALLPDNNNDNHDLKRYGIEATWPASLSATELFGSLIGSQKNKIL
ncbi:MAG: hypothetical protein IPL78_18350 [Chloroflexi bacterium]|nr:hypothetical protein [Chloroflexota bacterium]